jgi:hypothetical protein
MESRFNGLLEGHGERLNTIELTSRVAAEKCDSVRDILTSWMITFEALETNIGKAHDNNAKTHERVNVIEDWLELNSQMVVETQGQISELSDLVRDQATTIRLLQGWIGELELGHHILQDCVLHIEVGQEPSSDLCFADSFP